MLSDFASVALSPALRLLLFESSSGIVLDETNGLTTINWEHIEIIA
jgi:hypothetical protein